MRVDFSEPECSTCYRLRTSGVPTAPRSEPPSNAIVSITSTPVQDPGHESSAAGSALVSPVEALGHEFVAVLSTPSPSPSFRCELASVSSSSASKQALGQTLFGFAGESAAPKELTFEESNQLPGFASRGLFGAPSSINRQNQGTGFGFCGESVAPKPPSTLGSCQTPAFGFSGESANPGPSATFGSYQAPAFGSGGESAPSAPAFGSGGFASRGLFGAPSSVNGQNQGTGFGFGGESVAPKLPSTLGSCQTPAFGSGGESAPSAPAFGSGGLLGSMQSPFQASGSSTTPSVVGFLGTRSGFGQPLSASTPMYGDYVTSAVPTIGYSPSSSSCNFFRQTPSTTTSAATVSSVSRPLPLFGNSVASARPDIGFSPASSSSGPNPSTSTVVFGTTPVSVSSLFGPAQHYPKANSVNASNCFPGFGVGYFPGSSSDHFGPKPLFGRCSTASAHDSISAGVRTSPPLGFNFCTATTHAPCSYTSPPATLLSSSPSFTSQLSASHEKGSWLTPFVPTPLENQQCSYGKFVSISASNLYEHKNHDELRWEDYNRGDKGGLLSSANISPIGRSTTGLDPWRTTSVSTPSPRPFGLETATTQFSSSPSLSSAPFSSRPKLEGSRIFPYEAIHSRENPGERLQSISASPFYQHKSHDELRWEDYNQGDKGVLFPASTPVTASQPAFNTFPAGTATSSSPLSQNNSASTGSAFASIPAGVTTSVSCPFGQTNAAPTGGSIFAPFSAGVTSFDGPFGQTMFPSTFAPSYTTYPLPLSPYETAKVSPPASGCTACGATTSSSPPGHFNFNGATTPPSAATTVYGSYPVMLGTPFVAYPAQNFILLPFSAMRLQ